MRRIIKVTEAQLRLTEGDAYAYIDNEDNDTKYYNNSEISAQGYEKPNEYGGPITTDQADVMTPQHWYRGYRGTAATTFVPNIDVLNYDRYPYVNESDSDKDGIDDFYEIDVDKNSKSNEILNSLSDEDNVNNNKNHNDDQYASETIQHKLNLLQQSMRNLASKTQVNVLQKIINGLQLKNIPYSWNSALQKKIKMRNNVSNKNVFQTVDVDTNNTIPPIVKERSDSLIKELNKYNDQKKAIVINALIETLDISGTSFSEGQKTINSLNNKQQRRFN